MASPHFIRKRRRPHCLHEASTLKRPAASQRCEPCLWSLSTNQRPLGNRRTSDHRPAGADRARRPSWHWMRMPFPPSESKPLIRFGRSTSGTDCMSGNDKPTLLNKPLTRSLQVANRPSGSSAVPRAMMARSASGRPRSRGGLRRAASIARSATATYQSASGQCADGNTSPRANIGRSSGSASCEQLRRRVIRRHALAIGADRRQCLPSSWRGRSRRLSRRRTASAGCSRA